MVPQIAPECSLLRIELVLGLAHLASESRRRLGQLGLDLETAVAVQMGSWGNGARGKELLRRSVAFVK